MKSEKEEKDREEYQKALDNLYNSTQYILAVKSLHMIMEYSFFAGWSASRGEPLEPEDGEFLSTTPLKNKYKQ